MKARLIKETKDIHVSVYKYGSEDEMVALLMVYNLLSVVPTLLLVSLTTPVTAFRIVGTTILTPVLGLVFMIIGVAYVNREDILKGINKVYNNLKEEADNYLKEKK